MLTASFTFFTSLAKANGLCDCRLIALSDRNKETLDDLNLTYSTQYHAV